MGQDQKIEGLITHHRKSLRT